MNCSILNNKSQKMSNVPELRFREFSGEWEEKKLIDTVDTNIKWSFTGGPFGSDLKSDDYTEEGVRIIQLQNIGDGLFLNDYAIYTSDEKADKLLSCNIYPNEIILSKMGDPVARACKMPLSDKRYVMASDGIRYVPDETEHSKDFLFFSINHPSFRKQAIINSTGSTRKRIGLTELRNLKFNVPSKQEQEKIASFLTSVDTKIEQLTKKEELLKQYKKGVMQQIFSQEIRFKADNGSEFEDWEEKNLGDLLKESKDKSTLSNQYEVLSSTKDDVVLQSEYFNREIASSDNTGYKILRINQLVFSPQNLWLGNINVNTKYEIGIVSPSYKIYDFKTNIANVSYFKYFLKTPKMMYEYGQASEQGASVVRRSLNIDLFNDIRIPTPSVEEQTKIANFLSSIDSKIEQVSAQLNSTKEFKKSIATADVCVGKYLIKIDDMTKERKLIIMKNDPSAYLLKEEVALGYLSVDGNLCNWIIT